MLNAKFLYDYVMNAPLTVEALTINAAKVHNPIVNFITNNDEAESVVKVQKPDRYGMKYWNSLKTHYEVQGININHISKAEVDLKNLFYAGENNPHVWWVEFERKRNFSFRT